MIGGTFFFVAFLKLSCYTSIQMYRGEHLSMSQKQNKPTELHRMVDVSTAQLNHSKEQSLLYLRQKLIDTANSFVNDIFQQEPLDSNPTKKELQNILLEKQKDVEGLNKGYAEKARIQAQNVVHEAHRRYFRRLIGRLAHASERIKEKDASRLYYYVPQHIENIITEKQLKELEAFVKQGSTQKALDLFRAVVLEKESHPLDALQVQVIQEMHRQVLQKHQRPQFAKGDDFCLQIHLDYRFVTKHHERIHEMNERAVLIFDEENKQFKTFLSLSNPIPRGKRIQLPICIRERTIKRLDRQGRLKSIVLELSENGVKVKLVFAKQKTNPKPVETCQFAIGRDFGYTNTCTLSVAKIEQTLDEQEVARLCNLDKEEAKQYLSTHVQKDDNIVERKQFNGKRFLALMNEHCEHIRKLSSQIDGIYNKIERLKGWLVGTLRLAKDAWISKESRFLEENVQRNHQKFFLLLELVEKLKRKRRWLYKKMLGVRKSWFGFVANEEVSLAKKYKAIVIREKLTLKPIEKESIEYKGKAFNKMLSNGARGTYENISGQKLEFWGIGEYGVGAWYTSSTCIKHGLVDKQMRKSQESFVCPLCAKEKNADMNAADVLANYFGLKAIDL